MIAELEEGRTPVDLLGTIFPCGSVTGAPKIRAMEIIASLEREQRGPYTVVSAGLRGRRGRVQCRDPTWSCVTASVSPARPRSGIVADSVAADEWRECLAKGEFVATARRFDLIETMRFDPHEGIAELDRHLARMKRSADALGFAFDRHHARNELQAATSPKEARSSGCCWRRAGPGDRIAASARGAGWAGRGGAGAAAVEPDDFRLKHKTSDRRFYDEAHEVAGTFEVAFVDDEDSSLKGASPASSWSATAGSDAAAGARGCCEGAARDAAGGRTRGGGGCTTRGFEGRVLHRQCGARADRGDLASPPPDGSQARPRAGI